MLSLIRYLFWYLKCQVKWFLNSFEKNEETKLLNQIIYGYHPSDFRQDLSAWLAFRKLSPENLACILSDSIIHHCEFECDEIEEKCKGENVDCQFCYLLKLKDFFDKWYPEKSNLIGRFDRNAKIQSK